MACLAVLKSDIKELERTFPASHSRLQIVSASVDELTCKFVDHQGKKHVIHANITVSTEYNVVCGSMPPDICVIY